MKNDIIYPMYLSYLETKLNTNVFGKQISKAQYSFFKISNSYFLEFKDRFEEDELFQKKVIKVHASETRDKKIEDIFNDTN